MASRSCLSIAKSDADRDPTKISIMPIPVIASAPDSKAAGQRGGTPGSPRRTQADVSIRCVATPQCQADKIAARSSGSSLRIRPINRSRADRSTTLRKAASIVAVVPDVPRICAAEATRSLLMLRAVFVVTQMSLYPNRDSIYQIRSCRLLCPAIGSVPAEAFGLLSRSSRTEELDPNAGPQSTTDPRYAATGTA
jgi:hypothetical protein